jgi:hypothetical protein
MQQRANHLIELQAVLITATKWQTCLNCIDWSKDKEICNRFNARPPAHIIVSGCQDHFADIPF